jgi:5-methylcytosine-specific restriction endonuclease McrA
MTTSAEIGPTSYLRHLAATGGKASRKRAKVLLRRGHRCEYCGLAPSLGYLEVHHLDRDHGNDKLNNLRVLCWWCHQVVHAGGRYRNFTTFVRYHGKDRSLDFLWNRLLMRWEQSVLGRRQ